MSYGFGSACIVNHSISKRPAHDKEGFKRLFHEGAWEEKAAHDAICLEFPPSSIVGWSWIVALNSVVPAEDLRPMWIREVPKKRLGLFSGPEEVGVQ